MSPLRASPPRCPSRPAAPPPKGHPSVLQRRCPPTGRPALGSPCHLRPPLPVPFSPVPMVPPEKETPLGAGGMERTTRGGGGGGTAAPPPARRCRRRLAVPAVCRPWDLSLRWPGPALGAGGAPCHTPLLPWDEPPPRGCARSRTPRTGGLRHVMRCGGAPLPARTVPAGVVPPRPGAGRDPRRGWRRLREPDTAPVSGDARQRGGGAGQPGGAGRARRRSSLDARSPRAAANARVPPARRRLVPGCRAHGRRATRGRAETRSNAHTHTHPLA